MTLTMVPQWRAGRGARPRCTAALHCTALCLRSPARNMLPCPYDHGNMLPMFDQLPYPRPCRHLKRLALGLFGIFALGPARRAATRAGSSSSSLIRPLLASHPCSPRPHEVRNSTCWWRVRAARLPCLGRDGWKDQQGSWKLSRVSHSRKARGS